MISGGEIVLNLRRFDPFQATVPIDLDKSPRGPLPNAANQPIPEGRVTANDLGQIRLEDISSFFSVKFGGVRAIRVRANSEVPGLFGKEGGGWSPYSVVIEETGLAYAQIVEDGAKSVYGNVYRLDHKDFGGAAKRALEIAVEIIAGYELAQTYQNSAHPLYRLARLTLKGEKPSKDLLDQAKASIANGPKKALLDIDHDDTKYEPAIYLIAAHENTSFASFDTVQSERQGDRFCIRFQSEVNKPEYGQTPPSTKKPEEADPYARYPICFTEGGLQVYNVEKREVQTPSTSLGRLRLNAATGLVALANLDLKFPLTEALREAIPKLTTNIGLELPKKDQIEYGDKTEHNPWSWDGLGLP